MIRATKLLLTLIVGISAAYGAGPQVPVRAIVVHARRYAFDPPEISVKKGETVQLKLFSDDVPHSLLIKELGINQVVSKKSPAAVTFTAAQAGTFHGQCGRFCGEGHARMLLTVHVAEN